MMDKKSTDVYTTIAGEKPFYNNVHSKLSQRKVFFNKQ